MSFVDENGSGRGYNADPYGNKKFYIISGGISHMYARIFDSTIRPVSASDGEPDEKSRKPRGLTADDRYKT